MWRSYTFSFIFLFIIFVAVANAQDNKGMIIGSLSKRGKPFRHKVNLHHSSGMFFLSDSADKDGKYIIKNIPFGEYYLILYPIIEIPFSWRTEKFTLDKNNPVLTLGDLDPFSVRPIFPTDGSSISPDEIDKENPLIFRWTAYTELDESKTDKAKYQLEIFSMNKKQYFQTEYINQKVYYFDGQFTNGSHLQKCPYQWRLKIFPDNLIWYATSHLRELSPADLGEIRPYEGEHIVLEVPKWYEPTIEHFNLINFLDVAYQLEKKLSGVSPLDIQKGVIIYDPTIRFAHSGWWVEQPIHFGKGWFSVEKAPWFGFFHEMGHDFQTGTIKNFSDLIVHQSTGIPIYSGFVEGFASIAYFYGYYQLDKNGNKYEIDKDVCESMKKDYIDRRSRYLNALENYEDRGAIFDHINPDIVDGMLIEICENYGWNNLETFFRYFHDGGPIGSEVVDQAKNVTDRITIIVASLSAAMGDDLLCKFREWNFPINNDLYNTIYSML